MIESFFVGAYNFCKKRCTRFEVWRGFLQKRMRETRTTALLSKIHIMSNILEAKQDKDSSYHPLAKMIPRHAHLKIRFPQGSGGSSPFTGTMILLSQVSPGERAVIFFR